MYHEDLNHSHDCIETSEQRTFKVVLDQCSRHKYRDGSSSLAGGYHEQMRIDQDNVESETDSFK